MEAVEDEGDSEADIEYVDEEIIEALDSYQDGLVDTAEVADHNAE